MQVDSMEEADRRIDELAASGKLDPALLLLMAKAYSGTRDTDKTRDEARRPCLCFPRLPARLRASWLPVGCLVCSPACCLLACLACSPACPASLRA